MSRRSRAPGPDRAEFRRSLRRLRHERAARADAARRRLARLAAEGRAGEGDARGGKMRLISIHLEEWQIEAAKLVAEIRGGTYQEWVRAWVTAGLLAEASSKRKRGE